MPIWMWDASASAKRYLPEVGAETVGAIFRLYDRHLHAFTLLGYAETYSILRRRFNSGQFSFRQYAEALTTLDADILENSSI